MPELDGPTWVRQVLLNWPETQVIFMSGNAQYYLADQQAVLRGSGFLPKPFSLSQLAQTVQSQLADGPALSKALP